MLNRIRYFSILALLAAPGAAVFAQSDAVKRDRDYSRELNKLGLHDFSTRFLLERMNETNNDKSSANFYRVQLADTYLASGKTDEAKKTIEGIPKNDPAYYDSLGTLGIYYFTKKDNAAALKPLEELYRYLRDKKIALSSYERPLTALWNIYIQEGDERKADELTNWIAGENSDQRSKELSKAIALLSTAENSRRAEQLEKDEFERRLSAMMKDKSKQTQLTTLRKKIDDLTKSVVANPGDMNKQRERNEAYKQLGGILGMDLERLMKIHEMDLARKKTAVEVRNRDKWSSRDKERLRRIDPNDWQTAVLAAAVDLHEIQWGGQDMITARATAQIIHCFYLLGEYEEAGIEVRRYPDLFDASDEVMEKEGRKQESPAADAKFWTGRSYLAMAEQAEAEAAEAKKKGEVKKKNELEKEAVTYYRRAFKYLGKLVKYYPQFKDAPAAYKDFQKVTEKAIAIDSDKRTTYQNEFSKVKPPEIVDQTTLVSEWAEQNYAAHQYDLVVDELLPVLRKTAMRYTPAISELVNRLMLSYAYLGDSTNAVILGSYAALLPKDNFVTTGLLNAGHVLWKQAAETTEPVRAAQLKGDALTLYRLLLECDMLNPYADRVALRVAREHLNSASRIGTRLNASSNSAERTALKKQWLSEVDKAATAYKLIMDNFGSSEFIDEAYLKYADCLAIQDDPKLGRPDYERAANVLKKYLVFGPSSPSKAAVVQEIIPEILSREADALAALASKKYDEAVGNPMMLAEADRLKAEATEKYGEVVEDLLTFRKDLEEGGKYASVVNTEEVRKAVRRADSLLPWMYYSAEQWDEAIDALKEFVQKHQKDPSAPKCLMCIASIYKNRGRESEAAEIMKALINSYPDSPEAKNARFELAKTLYSNGSFSMAANLFGELSPDRDQTLSIATLRWMATNLAKCPDESASVACAEVALSAAKKLLMEIRDPNLDDWFSEDQDLALLKSNRAAAVAAVNRLEQRLYLEAGIAAARAGQLDLAVEYLDDVDRIETDKDYCFFDKHFAMAEIRDRQKRYDDERSELAQIATKANIAATSTSDTALRREYFDLYNKAQVLIGESYLKSEPPAYNKAYATFSIVAAGARDPDSEYAREENSENGADIDLETSWIEQAVYRAAHTAAILGKTEERDHLIRIYRSNFPGGDYFNAIGTLPQSQAQ